MSRFGAGTQSWPCSFPESHAHVQTMEGCAAEPATDPAEVIDCGLVLRSVGYRAVPLPDVPFDERYFMLPNDSHERVAGQGHRPGAGTAARQAGLARGASCGG